MQGCNHSPSLSSVILVRPAWEPHEDLAVASDVTMAVASGVTMAMALAAKLAVTMVAALDAKFAAKWAK
jgi:hypothetical protein